MKRIANFLIKYRHFLLVLMLASGLLSISLFPKINIVSDMTTYLPDDSKMKQGLDCMKESFSGIDMNGAGVSAMFTNEAVNDSLAVELSKTDGVITILSTRSNDRYTLYQLITDPDSSPDEVTETIRSRYGDAVTVETTSASLLPDNMDFIIIAGVSLLTLILVIMCSSVVEVVLFLVAIGIAVAINIGSNAFLPGVSMVTNAIAAILQLILSMDYSIILMNRYRQTRVKIPEKVEAMTHALAKATPTILSSAMTTILGMAMLALMDFKIGLDMGMVLSKGVFLSLVSIYFVLPSLVLAFDKAIQKTEKKVPLLHTYKLAKFEVRFRILIATAFVIFFAASYFLSKRTDICFSSTWPTEITREFPPQNQTVILYETDEEVRIIPVIDSIGSDPKVMTAMSYPSIMLKERTAAEMVEFIKGMSSMLPGGAESPDAAMLTPELLEIVYYAASHPERNERMSFSDIEKFVSELPAEYMSGFDIESMMQDVTADFIVDDDEEEDAADTLMKPVAPAVNVAALDTTEAVVIEEPFIDDHLTLTSRFTAQNSTRELTSKDMADFLGFDSKQASAIYRMAGKAKSVMTPQEFVHYITDKILTRNIYSKMISDEQKTELASVRHQIDSAVVAGARQRAMAHIPDSLHKEPVIPADTAGTVALAVDTTTAQQVPQPEAEPIAASEPTPFDMLLDMVGSDRKYPADKIGRTLRNAGIDVAQSDVDLLFLYYGSRNSNTDSLRMSISGIMDFMTGTLLTDPMYGRFIDESAKEGIMAVKQSMTEGLGNLRGEKYSIATVISDYETESGATFDFIAGLSGMCENNLQGDSYLIGESVMYKEMKDGFAHEMRVVTTLTIIVIFMVVALTFRSLIVPVFLLLIILSAVYVCVFVGGLGGKPMNYLAYLVTQSILMGATIDYAILFTGYYREKRMYLPIAQSLRKSYKNSIHSIMTSGLILILCPYIMSVLLQDPTISTILSSISTGALSAILLIIFVLPGLLAAFDRIVVKKGSHPRE